MPPKFRECPLLHENRTLYDQQISVEVPVDVKLNK